MTKVPIGIKSFQTYTALATLAHKNQNMNIQNTIYLVKLMSVIIITWHLSNFVCVPNIVMCIHGGLDKSLPEIIHPFNLALDR